MGTTGAHISSKTLNYVPKIGFKPFGGHGQLIPSKKNFGSQARKMVLFLPPKKSGFLAEQAALQTSNLRASDEFPGKKHGFA